MQRKRFEAEALERQVAQMAEIDRRKDEFLAILAHELRNPLQPLQTAVELMEHDADAAGARARARHHRAPGPRTSAGSSTICSTSRGSRPASSSCAASRSSLDAIVNEAVDDVRRARRGAQAHARRSTASTSPPIVHGDPVRLVQVLSNLLVERDQVHRPGRRDRGRAAAVDGDDAFVRVTDNGRGIPPSCCRAIFDMFVQERTTPDGEGGLGLGLGLVKRLVELHGGTRARDERRRRQGRDVRGAAAARRRGRARDASSRRARRPAPHEPPAARGGVRRRAGPARAASPICCA